MYCKHPIKYGDYELTKIKTFEDFFLFFFYYKYNQYLRGTLVHVLRDKYIIQHIDY